MEKICGTIDSCKSLVTISGHGSKVGGIAGISESGKITNCINYNEINGEIYSGGICGYSKNTVIDYCGNDYNATITSTAGYTGGIIGFVESQNAEEEFAIQKCYNYGRVESSIATGGIVGGAWNEDGEEIVIQCCYNMGNIKSSSTSNGGILGGTYNIFDETNTSTDKNSIIGCYNLGTIDADFPNQISNKYANVKKCFYLRDQENTSGYGEFKFLNSFKKTTSASVMYQLNLIFPGEWVIDENINDGYVSLAWQSEY